MTKLRELTRSDLATINAWRADSALITLLGAPFRYINRETEEQWFDAYLKSRANQVRCCICTDTTETPLGLISLLDIDHVHRNAELHVMIGSANDRGAGHGSFAVRAMLSHAFLDLNLHRVWLRVLEDNAPALAFYSRLGFIEEGRQRAAAYKAGEYKNVVLMSILCAEFASQRKAAD